jgi:hypothetical protein
VLIVTGDPVGARMAGPAIRVVSIARECVRRGHQVRILSTSPGTERGARDGSEVLAVQAGDHRALLPHERWAEVIIVQGYGLGQFPALRRTDRALVADVYDPIHLELLEQGRELPAATWALRVDVARAAIVDQVRRADLLLCANESQRHFYLGHLGAVGRLSPKTYSGDSDLSGLLCIVPFGLPSEPPERSPSGVLRGVRTGVDGSSRILLWGGGIYSWFDPLTLIRAVALMRERIPTVRLLFLGTQHPGVDTMGIVGQAQALAVEVGVDGREVLFNDDWVPYDERGRWFLEADAGVSTHHAHLETTFAFRTRILDYLWAGLPMVVTEGDGFADLVRAESLGLVVPANDVHALANALARVLADTAEVAEWRANVAKVRERFTWSTVLEPLLRFIDNPQRAADYTRRRGGMGTSTRPRRTAGAWHDARMAMHHLRHAGLAGLADRVRNRRGKK